MKYSLRKTPSHLHLAYKYGEASDGLMGRHFVLETQERVLTLSIDLTPNFHTRNKAATAYLNAVNFPHNHHKLRYLQCSDNLVRARLIKAWEQVQHPQLRMCLELGAARALSVRRAAAFAFHGRHTVRRGGGARGTAGAHASSIAGISWHQASRMNMDRMSGTICSPG